MVRAELEAYANHMGERRDIDMRWRIAQRNLYRIWYAKKDALGLTQEKAGELMRGITQGAVGQYIRGVISLNERAVLEFAKLLQVHPTEIDPSFNILPTESHSSANGSSSLNYVPLMSGHDIKRYIAEGLTMGHPSEKWIPSPATVSDRSFAFVMVGSSMEPAIKDGDTVIVDPNVPVTHGSVVLVYTGSATEAIFRRFMRDGGRTYLQAVNPSWPHPIEQAGPDVGILGVAICNFSWL